MNLSSAISTALGGLGDTTRRLGIASGNIANATTEGYAARRAVTEDGPAPRVVAARRTDPQLTALRRGADSEAAAAKVRAEALVRLADGVGEYGDAGSLAERSAALGRAFSALGDDPASLARQENAASAARDLAKGFREAEAGVRGVRAGADAAIGRLVAGINDDLAEIATLNRRVVRARALGQDATALEERRESRIDAIGAALPLRLQDRPDGSVEVRTAEGVLLAEREARRLDFTPAPAVTPAMTRAGGALSGLRIGERDVTPGGGSAQAVEGGALAAHFAVRDDLAPALQADLDAAAADLMARFEAPGLDPTLAAGAAGLFTDRVDPLGAPPPPGLAGRLEVNAALDGTPWRLRDGLGAAAPGPAGASVLPRALAAALAERRPGPDGTLADASGPLAAIAERASLARIDAEDAETAAATTRATQAEAEGAVRGVDAEAELAHLVTLERAFAANARVLETTSRMLDALESIK
ncbi:MAG: flagellar basal body rod C-terminal domain-containing protein [Paracoccaceae bacterium]